MRVNNKTTNTNQQPIECLPQQILEEFKSCRLRRRLGS